MKCGVICENYWMSGCLAVWLDEMSNKNGGIFGEGVK